MNKELFYSELSKDLKKKFGTSVEKALPWQLHESLSANVMELIDSDWENSRKAHLDRPQSLLSLYGVPYGQSRL